MNFKVNKPMIPIKLWNFLWHVATYMTFPYLTVQMIQIGLTMEDVGIVYGFTPLLTFLVAPLSGYIGDKIGYNLVMAIHIFLAAISSTAFDWIPRYKEYYQIPMLTVMHHDHGGAPTLHTHWQRLAILSLMRG